MYSSVVNVITFNVFVLIGCLIVENLLKFLKSIKINDKIYICLKRPPLKNDQKHALGQYVCGRNVRPPSTTDSLKFRSDT